MHYQNQLVALVVNHISLLLEYGRLKTFHWPSVTYSTVEGEDTEILETNSERLTCTFLKAPPKGFSLKSDTCTMMRSDGAV